MLSHGVRNHSSAPEKWLPGRSGVFVRRSIGADVGGVGRPMSYSLAVLLARRHLRHVKRFFLFLAVALATLAGPVRHAAAEDPALNVRASVEPGRLGVGESG